MSNSGRRHFWEIRCHRIVLLLVAFIQRLSKSTTTYESLKFNRLHWFSCRLCITHWMRLFQLLVLISLVAMWRDVFAACAKQHLFILNLASDSCFWFLDFSFISQRWHRRWFTLKQGELPEQFCLDYYTDSDCRTLKGVIDLDQCERVDSGLRLEKFQHIFFVQTPRRTYYLAAASDDDMNYWVKCICQVCNLRDFSPQNGANDNRQCEYWLVTHCQRQNQ